MYLGHGNFDITIGNFRLAMLNNLEIISSVELLADTAKIVLPATAYNQTLDVESKIKDGDRVIIKFGYDDELVTEFEGWLQSISTDDGSITLNCEDDIYLTRKAIKDKVLTDVTVKELAQYVADAIGGDLKINCSYDFKYNKFTIHKATGFDVLKKIQDEVQANIYISDSAINIHPVYQNIGGRVRYNFSVNIESSDLKYKSAKDKKYQIEVEGIMADGKRISTTIGTAGGDKRSVKIYGVYDIEMLKKRGEEELKNIVYDGYEGNITTWLIPFVKPSYSAEIIDLDYPKKDGWYFVTSVTTTISVDGGGVRKIELGKKLS